MRKPDPHAEALARTLAECDELWRRILAGEDAAALLAEVECRVAAQQRLFRAQLAEWQAAVASLATHPEGGAC
jgi:hypothetical protein